MSGAAVTAAALAVDTAALLFSVALGIWLPVVAAVALTAWLALSEVRRCWKRWRVTRMWARRLSN